MGRLLPVTRVSRMTAPSRPPATRIRADVGLFALITQYVVRSIGLRTPCGGRRTSYQAPP
jgi:hypothetical protein